MGEPPNVFQLRYAGKGIYEVEYSLKGEKQRKALLGMLTREIFWYIYNKVASQNQVSDIHRTDLWIRSSAWEGHFSITLQLLLSATLLLSIFHVHRLWKHVEPVITPVIAERGDKTQPSGRYRNLTR